jgi:hypothetical protein
MADPIELFTVPALLPPSVGVVGAMGPLFGLLFVMQERFLTLKASALLGYRLTLVSAPLLFVISLIHYDRTRTEFIHQLAELDEAAKMVWELTRPGLNAAKFSVYLIECLGPLLFWVGTTFWLTVGIAWVAKSSRRAP